MLVGRALLGLCSPALAADSDSPEAELASFQIADGFDVRLFASEKDGVVKPIQMRFDPQGRLWVIGSTVYPQIEPGQVPNDKVLILEDTDGDGRCHKTTVFADGLTIPTGIELTADGAYIGHGTELLRLTDTDGDGKADKRHVVLRGFGTGDNHQNINSFLWGPGGELWMSQGLHIRSSVETPWGLVRLNQAGIWRLWPRRLKLEGFYGSEHEPQNPWGFIFTYWGEPIVLAGNNSSPIYPVPGLVSNHRDDAPSLIWKNGNGRKVSNGDIVGTAHFPEAWQGALIVGGYINNAVWALRINDDGSGFVLEDLPPLIKSSSRSFRPVDAKFGPDGALYLCDWYNPIIGHYQASFRDPNRDKTHGRIWRVTAKGRALTRKPQLTAASVMELLTQTKSADRWTRHFAKRVLADRPTDQVVAALKEWTTNSSLSEHDLMEALGVYQSHEVLAPELLARLCQAAEPGARAYAAGVVGNWADRLPAPLNLLRPLVADQNPRVRLQAVVACTYVPRAEALEVAAMAADLPTDKFLTYALNQAVFALKPYWLPAFKTGKLNLDNKISRLGLLVRADNTPDTLDAVRQLARSPQSDPSSRSAYWRILAENGDANDVGAILHLENAGLQAELIPVISSTARARRLEPPPTIEEDLRPLTKSENPGLRVGALKLAAIWRLYAFRAGAELVAMYTADSEHTRRAAIESLGLFGDDSSAQVLSRLVRDDLPATVQSAALAALSLINLPNAASLASLALARLKDEAALKEIFTAFLQRQGGAQALAASLSTNPPPKLAAQIGIQVMNSSGRRDDRLSGILVQAVGLSGHTKGLTSEAVATLAAEIRTSGDPKHGEEVFRRAELGCTVCHTVNGQGGTIGPNLSALGTAQPVEFIVGAILDPQKEIKEGYMSVSITTKDGEEYQGYQVRETPAEVVLRDVLQDKEVRIRRDTIREKKQNGSVMPNGLADLINHDEFRDLVRFLSELGKAK